MQAKVNANALVWKGSISAQERVFTLPVSATPSLASPLTAERAHR